MSQKRKSAEFVEDSDSSDSGSSSSDPEPKKEKKKEKKARQKEEKPAKKPKKQEKDNGSDDDDDPKSGWELGRMRKVTINEFKGKLLIDIREYYTDAAGDMKPGRKGISLQREQWEKLLSLTDKVNSALKK